MGCFQSATGTFTGTFPPSFEGMGWALLQIIRDDGRSARGEALDERPMPELDSEALDFRAASESFAPVRKLTRADLETLRLL